MSEEFPLNIPVEDFHEICRVCLLKIEPLYTITNVLLNQNKLDKPIEELFLRNIFQKYCNVMVHKDDLKPQNICNICLNLVSQAFHIFEVFRDSNRHLDTILRQYALKLAKGTFEDTLKRFSLKKLKVQVKAEESIIILDSESDDDNLNNLEHDNDNTKENTTLEDLAVEVDIQYLQEPMETQGLDNEVVKIELESRTHDNFEIPPIVKLPKTGGERWDHTYYVKESKFLERLESKLKPKKPNIRKRKPKEISEFKKKKMLLKFKFDNEIFNCKFCEDTELHGMDKVIEHMKSVHPIEEECLLCPKKFSKSKLLLYHVASHAKKQDLVCNKCEIFFKDRQAMEVHYASDEHKTKKPKCKTCDKTYSSKKGLSMHVQAKHIDASELKAQCPICGLVLLYKYNLDRHLQTHTELKDRKKFMCHQCANCFTTKSALGTHVMFVHEGKPKLHKYKYKKTYHAKKVKEVQEHQCDYCPKIFKSHYTFFKHRISHPECSNIACPYCDLVLDTVAAYQKHRFADHRTFICEQCKKGYPSQAMLWTHKYNHHPIGRSYRCSKCFKSCKSAQILLVHENAHNNVKPYACKLCGKRFVQQSQLSAHEVCIHQNGKRKHRCTMCEKSFLYKSSLQAHMRVHTGFKPFICPFCKKTFTNTTARHKHVKRDHPEKWTEFEIFKKENQSREAELANYVNAPDEEPEAGNEEST